MRGCDNELILEVFDVSKDFGNLSAVEDVSFCVCKGVIYGLVGSDGAENQLCCE